MTVLVTGGAGFIGSTLVRRLVLAGQRAVVNVDKLTYAGNRASLGNALYHPLHSFVQADICDAETLRELFELNRPDAVVHLAAESHVDRSIDGPLDFINTNLVGTFRLLEEARRYWTTLDPGERQRFRFLHVSTDEVFGSLEAEGRFTDATPYDPSSPYSATKAGADHLVRAWGRTYGLPVIVSNCSNNFGPYQFPEKLIPLMITNAHEGKRLPVYGAGENVRDWLYVEDHVDALLAMLDRGQPSETYLVGGFGERRNIDVVRAICRILDERTPCARIGPRERLIDFVEDRPGHDYRYAIDPTKVVTQLGWEPRVSFEAGLRQTVAWYLENREWCEAVRSGTYRGERLGIGSAT